MDDTPTVLIVDDDAVTRGLLRHMLAHRGYTVRVAANGQDALTLLEDERVDLAIVDRSMPVLDGVGLVTALRASGRHRTLPVIMLTASIGPSVQEEAEAIGVTRLLTKLTGAQELVGAVDELLARSKSSEARSETDPLTY
jgi:two-component system, chemotaxis family, chemotaxis protein CheY